jgi:hypothetical protein
MMMKLVCFGDQASKSTEISMDFWKFKIRCTEKSSWKRSTSVHLKKSKDLHRFTNFQHPLYLVGTSDSTQESTWKTYNETLTTARTEEIFLKAGFGRVNGGR